MTRIKAGHTVEFELKDVVNHFNDKYNVHNNNLKNYLLKIESGTASAEMIENMKILIKEYASMKLYGHRIKPEILESNIKDLLD
jgi:hypothetical protein